MANVIQDQQLLREIMVRELETIHRYQDMLERAGHPDLQRFLAHAIFEEKEHVAEALQILRALDPMQDAALGVDHSEHFRPDGAGARALAALRGNAPIAAKAAADAPPAPAQASPVGKVAPSANLSAPTVGNLRQRA